MCEKTSFKVLATSSSLEIVLPFSINTILSLDLTFSEKWFKSLPKFFVIDDILFLKFSKVCFFSFLKSDAYTSRCFL